MRYLAVAMLTACQLEDFSVDVKTDPPETAPAGAPAVTTPDPISEQGVWVERDCALESYELSVTWIVELSTSAGTPQFTGYHLYSDDMWREPTGTAMDPYGDGILYSWSGAIDCIAWEWMEPEDTGGA
jgi:hypothetical protein